MSQSTIVKSLCKIIFQFQGTAIILYSRTIVTVLHRQVTTVIICIYKVWRFGNTLVKVKHHGIVLHGHSWTEIHLFLFLASKSIHQLALSSFHLSLSTSDIHELVTDYSPSKVCLK